jgi:DNA-binding GntR family transcriptional regulator
MLKQAILSGELKAGQPLVEASLAAWCQVSRTPIREALRRLEQDGLIERSDRGLVIRERSPQEILDIYETRITLEATAGRMAAERRTDHDVRLLRRLHERGEQIPPEDISAVVEANRQFHRAVWRASHNDSLLDLLERLNLHLLRYPETTLAAPGRWKEARHQHARLVDAIEARDSEGAYRVAFEHFVDARDIRLALFADEGSDL